MSQDSGCIKGAGGAINTSMEAIKHARSSLDKVNYFYHPYWGVQKGCIHQAHAAVPVDAPSASQLDLQVDSWETASSTPEYFW